MPDHWIFLKDGKLETIQDNMFIMLWTGLTDKNGAKIFEGDIINVPYNYIGKREVKYLGGAWSIHGYDIKQIEIIGNIHEAEK